VSSIAERAKKIIAQKPELFLVLEELDRTGKLRKVSYKKRENFTIDETVMNEFRSLCREKNMKMSAVVEQLMRKWLAQKNQQDS
jgi:type I restriction-modification system DNA methylase subunit